MMSPIFIIELPGEREFLAYVRVNSKLGYGRMMQIIATEWFRVDPIGGSDRGVRDVNTLLELDPIFKDDRP